MTYLGGTIGLFTGVSLISIIEAAYWLLSAFFVACNSDDEEEDENVVSSEDQAET